MGPGQPLKSRVWPARWARTGPPRPIRITAYTQLPQRVGFEACFREQVRQVFSCLGAGGVRLHEGACTVVAAALRQVFRARTIHISRGSDADVASADATPGHSAASWLLSTAAVAASWLWRSRRAAFALASPSANDGCGVQPRRGLLMLPDR